MTRILHKDLDLTAYKVQLVQDLKPINHRFAKRACDRLTEDADFGKKKIILSDEAHFDLGGYVNQQHWEILQHNFENHGNVAECVRKLCTDFGRREAPLTQYVRYLVKKVKETGILIDKPKR